MSDLFKTAEMYRSWGLSVFPVGGTKMPTVKWKPRQYRRPSPDRLASDFAYTHAVHGPASGLAVVHGAVSRWLGCRDFDVADAYHQWAERHPDAAAKLPTVRTPRGYHVWFRCRPESFHDDETGEFRANSTHYSVLPPTVRTDKDGFVYRWTSNEPTGYKSFPIIDPVACGLRPPYLPSERPSPFADRQWVIDVANLPDSVSTHSLSPPSLSLPLGLETPLCQIDDCCTDSCETIAGSDFVPDGSVMEAVARSLTRRKGERHASIFLLARRLKAIEADVPAVRWIDVFREWWVHSLPRMETKSFRVSWDDFVAAWDVCRPYIPRLNHVTLARQAAQSEQGSDAKIRAVCRELARAKSDGRFMLASTLAGDLTGLSQKTAFNTLSRLVQRGELTVVEKSRPGNMGVGHVYQLTATA